VRRGLTAAGRNHAVRHTAADCQSAAGSLEAQLASIMENLSRGEAGGFTTSEFLTLQTVAHSSVSRSVCFSAGMSGPFLQSCAGGVNIRPQ